MKYITNKSAALFLTFLMLLSIIVSCASGDETPISTAFTGTVEEDTAPAETKIDPKLPTDVRYDGYEFKVLTKGLFSKHWYSVDISSSEINGEPINDAVYARNLAVNEKYGVTVVDIPGNYYNLDGDATKAILSGDDVYDMLCYCAVALINNGYLVNLYDVPYLNLKQPYYNQNCIDSLTLKGKLFSVAGDLLIMDKNATWCVQFNKNIVNDLGLNKKYGKSLYDVVNDGEWTLGFMYETAKLAAYDVDGDGVMHELNDIWGILTESNNTYTFLVGCGERIASTDSNGNPKITLYGDRVASVIHDVMQIQKDSKVALDASALTGYADVWAEVMDKNFIESRALYNVAGINRITLFRTMEVDFGILPMPKYEQKQEKYCNAISYYGANFISIPKSATDLERTGIIIEALSCESMYTLLPAYYDITLKTKASRDAESLEMLELIFKTTVFDLGYYFYWGGTNALLATLKDAGTFASDLASRENAINTDIEKTLQAIDAS